MVVEWRAAARVQLSTPSEVGGGGTRWQPAVYDVRVIV